MTLIEQRLSTTKVIETFIEMTKWCAVPNCKTGSRTEQKRSLFRVPKDIVTWKKLRVE
ncbi:hypothetical protein X777_06240 [Ooceraea biroi]|uniref:Uncharacterized protein n=1 Tax=Ooceraea biroi TaxID=2015173 RepID=A0A026WBZ8_OOCBI|nr:hypothetical protein X777_06240 [Ooceraea biroi]